MTIPGDPTGAVHYQKYGRRWRLKTYGWTPEAYDVAFAEQDGKCAICGAPAKPKRNCVQGLYPDHLHSVPPVPRGLLCMLCNRAVGYLHDDPALAEAAAEYLRRYGKP